VKGDVRKSVAFRFAIHEHRARAHPEALLMPGACGRERRAVVGTTTVRQHLDRKRVSLACILSETRPSSGHASCAYPAFAVYSAVCHDGL